MQLENIELRKSFVKGLEEGLGNSKSLEWHSMSEIFFKKGTEFNEESIEFKVWSLLGAIFGMRLDVEDTKVPFKPMIVSGNSRSANLDDLSPNMINELVFLTEIKKSEFCARFADVCWLKLRKPELLEIAIQAYIDSSEKLMTATKDFCLKRLKRALSLSVILKKQGNEVFFEKVVFQLLEFLKTGDRKQKLRSLCALLTYCAGDLSENYTLSVKIAQESEQVGDFGSAERAWKTAYEWAKSLKDSELREAAHKGLAESYVTRSNADSFSSLASASWLQKALNIYKKVPKSRERRDEIYREFCRHNKRTLGEMTTVHYDDSDEEGLKNIVSDLIEGKSFYDAVFSLAFEVISHPPIATWKKEFTTPVGQFGLADLVSISQIDQDGLIVSKKPSLELRDDTPNDEIVWYKVVQSTQYYHSIIARDVLSPVQTYLYNSFYISERDCLDICIDNFFVPEGYERVVAKGLYFGFMGDFVSSIHILIPQMENCLRNLLQQLGVETSSLNNYGTQERTLLNSILEKPELKEFLGENAFCDLKILLVEKQYANLRNKVAHGFLPEGGFYTPQAIYFWWFMLRLCLLPYCSNPEEE